MERRARSLELEIETPQTIHYLKWSPGEAIEEEGIFPIDDIDRAALLIDWIAKGYTRLMRTRLANGQRS